MGSSGSAPLADELEPRPPQVTRMLFAVLAVLGALVLVALIVVMWMVVCRWL